MKRRALIQTASAIALLGIAVFLMIQNLGRSTPGEQAFFYDLSAQRIFAAPRTAIPPSRGVDGPEEDGFRALVISNTGRPQDRGSWRVAYLEKCSPELKVQMESAQATGEALAMGRGASQNHRFVRRLEDSEWHSMTSPEADEILTGWARPSSNGVTPVVCSP